MNFLLKIISTIHMQLLCDIIYNESDISDSLPIKFFRHYLKTAVIRTILKKTDLDKNDLNNYRYFPYYRYIPK